MLTNTIASGSTRATIGHGGVTVREIVVDDENRARKEQLRLIKLRERLKFRVYSAVRDVGLRTELFRTHAELHEPDISVNVYPRYVDLNICLTEGQLFLLSAAGRGSELTQFAEELRTGIARAAPILHLKFAMDPAQHGGSEPVMLTDVPCGFRAVLLRLEPE